MPRTKIPVDPSPEIVALPGSEIERLLSLGRNGALDDLQVAAPDAWAMQLPGLAAFVDWPDDAPHPTICIATYRIPRAANPSTYRQVSQSGSAALVR